jgi:hypothetical protein
MGETFWQKLRRSLGVEQAKPEVPKQASPSEQKALDRAIPRRFEPTVPPKRSDKPVAPKKAKRKPVKPAEAIAGDDQDEKDVTSSMYDFREEA